VQEGTTQMTDGFSMLLPVDVRSPKRARDAIQARFGHEPRCGDLLLCISEVVTNAVRHARTAAHLTVARQRNLLVVELSDQSGNLPVKGPPAPQGPSGRGLLILDQLSRRWGTRRTSSGKVVWFEFDLADVH
jgi:anti-sigma regulatory factor (Ser/Thr protein kinase)